MISVTIFLLLSHVFGVILYYTIILILYYTYVTVRDVLFILTSDHHIRYDNVMSLL